MSKLVVFGGTGYAGSRIAAEALRRGHEVTVVARNVPADTTLAAGLSMTPTSAPP